MADLARMIPNSGPSPTQSKGETLLYHLLREQLGEEFTVIHSLPWLCAAARKIAGTKAITGEIDFLVLHPELGVLALEVKGGAHKVQGLAFVHVQSGNTTRAIEQLRSNTHGLTRWLGTDPNLRVKFGYGLVFPHSDFRGQSLGPALSDPSANPPGSIVIDQPDLVSLAQRITTVMLYWKSALGNPSLGAHRLNAIVDAICPAFDGTPSWASRVLWDEQLWLRLTPEQSEVVDDAIGGKRLVITGWPGTGKTLVLIESARRLLHAGKSVLVLTFNALIADYIAKQLPSNGRLRVCTWHAFCGSAWRSRQGEIDRQWLESGCLEDVGRAADRGSLRQFDAILLDEAQTFRTEWVEWLCRWQGERQLLAFCDETQVFAFEGGRVSLSMLCALTGVVRPFALTTAIRSPNAVYQRLKRVRRPEYQLHIPRELQSDELQETLVAGARDYLDITISRLLASGVVPSDIVVLSKFGWLGTPADEHVDSGGQTVQFETLSRYRGMEAPIVIVYRAEDMDDAELFCAYSRATTLCIPIYDAEVLGARGAACDFHASLLSEEAHSATAEQARLSAQTREIVLAAFSPTWFNLSSVRVGWLAQWHAWVVEHDDALTPFWIDYLASQYPWPIFHWAETSLRTAYLVRPVASILDEGAGGIPHDMRPCDDCKAPTPQRRKASSLLEEWRCAICGDTTYHDAGRPDDSVLGQLAQIDQAVMAAGLRGIEEEQRKRLPLSLAAGAALLLADREPTREPLGLDQITSGRVVYHAALAFVYSLINLLPPAKLLSVDKAAGDLYRRYAMPGELTEAAWRREIALACGVAYTRGHLRKISKGVYATPD